jgi:hypothetical protein
MRRYTSCLIFCKPLRDEYEQHFVFASLVPTWVTVLIEKVFSLCQATIPTLCASAALTPPSFLHFAHYYRD